MRYEIGTSYEYEPIEPGSSSDSEAFWWGVAFGLVGGVIGTLFVLNVLVPFGIEMAGVIH